MWGGRACQLGSGNFQVAIWTINTYVGRGFGGNRGILDNRILHHVKGRPVSFGGQVRSVRDRKIRTRKAVAIYGFCTYGGIGNGDFFICRQSQPSLCMHVHVRVIYNFQVPAGYRVMFCRRDGELAAGYFQSTAPYRDSRVHRVYGDGGIAGNRKGGCPRGVNPGALGIFAGTGRHVDFYPGIADLVLAPANIDGIGTDILVQIVEGDLQACIPDIQPAVVNADSATGDAPKLRSLVRMDGKTPAARPLYLK